MQISPLKPSTPLLAFQQRVQTTLHNYENLLYEYNKRKPPSTPLVVLPPENGSFVESLLQEHRNNKNRELLISLKGDDTKKTERFQKENIQNRAETSRKEIITHYNSPNFSIEPLTNIENLLNKREIVNYMSFSDDKQKDFTKETPFHIKEFPKETSLHITNLYSKPLKIEDLMNISENPLPNEKSNEKSLLENPNHSFEKLRVEDRLTLRDIGRSLKLHHLITEKALKESTEIKATPIISDQSRTLAHNSIRFQQNPDIIKRLLEDHKITKVLFPFIALKDPFINSFQETTRERV